jgi:hypothetical protein
VDVDVDAGSNSILATQVVTLRRRRRPSFPSTFTALAFNTISAPGGMDLRYWIFKLFVTEGKQQRATKSSRRAARKPPWIFPGKKQRSGLPGRRRGKWMVPLGRLMVVVRLGFGLGLGMVGRVG